MINKLIETKKELANNWKIKMDYCQKIIEEVNPYESTEFLNTNCSMNFAKEMYMALTREIKYLKQLKEEYILNLNKKEFAKECNISRPYLDKLLKHMSKSDIYEFCKLKNKIKELI